MNKKLETVKSVLNEFPCKNERFVEADFDFGVYSDGYQVDVQSSSELFIVLKNLIEELGVGLEIHPLEKGVIRVFVGDE